MAIFTSNLVKKENRHRGLYSGKPYNVKGRLLLPAGTVLATGDDFLMVPIGENQRINKVIAYARGATGALAVSIGNFQMMDGDNPVVVRRPHSFGGELDQEFTSPETDPDAYAPAAALSTAREVLVTGAVGWLEGPIILGARVTTGATLAEDVEIYIGAEFDGETSPVETGGNTWHDSQSYLLGNN